MVTTKLISFIKKFIDHHPYNHIAWHYLGIVYQKKEDYLNAIEAYDYALLINEKHTLSYLQKAECFSSQGHYKKAIHTYKESLQFEEACALTYYNIGECYET